MPLKNNYVFNKLFCFRIHVRLVFGFEHPNKKQIFCVTINFSMFKSINIYKK